MDVIKKEKELLANVEKLRKQAEQLMSMNAQNNQKLQVISKDLVETQAKIELLQEMKPVKK